MCLFKFNPNVDFTIELINFNKLINYVIFDNQLNFTDRVYKSPKTMKQ